MIHPWWYYEYFDRVFGRGPAYGDEVASVLAGAPGEVTSVTEVGAGLGGHALALLSHGVTTLRLIDVDPIATRALGERFRHLDAVSVLTLNGFASTPADLEKSDLALCMYSLVQQVDSPHELETRIERLTRLIKGRGAIAFEYLDRGVSMEVHPAGQASLIFAAGGDHVTVTSRYPVDAIELHYEGILGDRPIGYVVRLAAVSERDVALVLSERGMKVTLDRALDGEGRRRVCVATWAATDRPVS